MTIEGTNAAVGLALSIAGLLVIVAGWLRWVRPKIRRGRREVTAVRDAILGREPIVDSITGKEIQPALPGMGVRMAHQEAQMELITAAVGKIADSHERLENHEGRIRKLEDAAVERVVARAESAQAWRAVEAALNADPPLDAEPTEGDSA